MYEKFPHLQYFDRNKTIDQIPDCQRNPDDVPRKEEQEKISYLLGLRQHTAAVTSLRLLCQMWWEDYAVKTSIYWPCCVSGLCV